MVSMEREFGGGSGGVLADVGMRGKVEVRQSFECGDTGASLEPQGAARDRGAQGGLEMQRALFQQQILHHVSNSLEAHITKKRML
jgi:hypothetical protein